MKTEQKINTLQLPTHITPVRPLGAWKRNERGRGKWQKTLFCSSSNIHTCTNNAGLLPLFSSQLTADGDRTGVDDDLVTFGTHTTHLADVALLVQLLFGFILQLADILHG